MFTIAAGWRQIFMEYLGIERHKLKAKAPAEVKTM